LDQKERDEIDADEEFDMDDVIVPDLGLDEHAVFEDYEDEVSAALYCYKDHLN
jgi:hypothetical protein